MVVVPRENHNILISLEATVLCFKSFEEKHGGCVRDKNREICPLARVYY